MSHIVLSPQFRDLKPPPHQANDRRFSMPKTLEMCKGKGNVYEYTLDVAAEEQAHVADAYYTRQNSGLDLKNPWVGDVYGNMPWSWVYPWIERAWGEQNNPLIRTITLLMPSNRTEQPFWTELVEPYRDHRFVPGAHGRFTKFEAHFLPTRHKFAKPGVKKPKGTPPFGLVMLFWDTRPLLPH